MDKKLMIVLGTLFGVIAFFFVQVWEAQKVTEEVENHIEETEDRFKYPWRYMELNSSKDLMMGNMEIAASNLTDEEKSRESAELHRRYHEEKEEEY